MNGSVHRLGVMKVLSQHSLEETLKLVPMEPHRYTELLRVYLCVFKLRARFVFRIAFFMTCFSEF
jgi:hypothetical protein